MAATFRIPQEIHDRATRYASEFGLSLNALVVIALDEFLARKAARARGITSDRVAVASEPSQEPFSIPPKLSRQQRRQLARSTRKLGGK